VRSIINAARVVARNEAIATNNGRYAMRTRGLPMWAASESLDRDKGLHLPAHSNATSRSQLRLPGGNFDQENAN